MGQFSVEDLRLRKGTRVVRPAKEKERPPEFDRGEKFLRGPVPLPWLQRAAALPGKALAVALALWYLKGLARCRTVKLTGGVTAVFGVGRKAAYRSLLALEEATLVAVERRRGRAPEVTILEFHPGDAPRL